MEKREHKEAAKLIKAADALIFSSGAGMGVDSGLPDFRGDEGFWKAYPPIRKLGYSFIDMANPQWFESDPQLAWAFYGHRFNMYRNTAPHRGFDYLLEMGKAAPHGYFAYTSNVDGHFQQAGFDTNRVVEVHGSIHHFQCLKGCSEHIYDAPDHDIPLDEETFKAEHPLPVCPNCGGLARPNILMFGDWGWISTRSREQQQRLDNFLRQFSNENIVVIEAGAGSALPTVRRFSEQISKLFDTPMIRINPRDPEINRSYQGSFSFSGGAEESLRMIYKEYRKL
ncbi:MAG: Sir2 family NAD-dependent protein deacetylase [Bacteroidota bacterium]|nr:Sir2 family NAD-dependent protein deacetylase [Bacteroidota bacterium]